MELVGKPRLKTVRDVIKSLNPIDIDEIWIAVAYLNEGGVGYIRDLITKVKKTKIIVCLDPGVTDGESLEKLITISSVECHFMSQMTAQVIFTRKCSFSNTITWNTQ